MDDHENTTDLGQELQGLFDQLRSGEPVLGTIIKKHALIWYDRDDGDLDVHRFTDFCDRASKLALELLNLRGQELIDAWIDGICDIDAGYDPQKPTLLERIDFEDVVRHYLTGGTAFGMSKNIKDRIDNLIQRDKLVILNNAARRRLEHE